MGMHRVVMSALLGVGLLLTLVRAEEPPSAPGVTLDQALHFTAPNGNPVVLEPGRYAVEAGETGIRFIKGPTAVLVQTQATTHTEQLSTPTALLIPGEGDIRHVVLLLPDGRGLDAIGSLSGVQSRDVYQVLGAGQISQAALQRTSAPPGMSGMVLQGATPSGQVPSTALIGPVPPVLVAPPDQMTLNGSFIRFAWQPTIDTPSSATYRVCVTVEGQTCQSQTAWNSPGVGQPRLTGTELQRDLPTDLFQGRRLTWTVEACVPHPLRLLGHGNLPDVCRIASPRHLSWPLPPPRLGSPSDGTTLTGFRPTLSIFTDVPGADSYLFCISQPGVACPTTSTGNNTTVVAQVDDYYRQWTPGQDLSQFTGQTVHWTAGACNSVSGCVYQQSVRAVTFPPVMAPVYLRLHSQFDVDEVWLTRGGVSGIPLQQDLLVQDLVPWQPPPAGAGIAPYYDTEVRVQIPIRHNPGLEPNVTPYYALDYMQEQFRGYQGSDAVQRRPMPAGPYRRLHGVSLAPGVHHVAGYTIVRETFFLFGHNASPGARHEQVLRGPDGHLYLYRPGALFVGHPELNSGPIRLDQLEREGYSVYQNSGLGVR